MDEMRKQINNNKVLIKVNFALVYQKENETLHYRYGAYKWFPTIQDYFLNVKKKQTLDDKQGRKHMH